MELRECSRKAKRKWKCDNKREQKITENALISGSFSAARPEQSRQRKELELCFYFYFVDNKETFPFELFAVCHASAIRQFEQQFFFSFSRRMLAACSCWFFTHSFPTGKLCITNERMKHSVSASIAWRESDVCLVCVERGAETWESKKVNNDKRPNGWK